MPPSAQSLNTGTDRPSRKSLGREVWVAGRVVPPLRHENSDPCRFNLVQRGNRRRKQRRRVPVAVSRAGGTRDPVMDQAVANSIEAVLHFHVDYIGRQRIRYLSARRVGRSVCIEQRQALQCASGTAYRVAGYSAQTVLDLLDEVCRAEVEQGRRNQALMVPTTELSDLGDPRSRCRWRRARWTLAVIHARYSNHLRPGRVRADIATIRSPFLKPFALCTTYQSVHWLPRGLREQRPVTAADPIARPRL